MYRVILSISFAFVLIGKQFSFVYAASGFNKPEKCVQIFYDKAIGVEETSPHANFGKIHSIYLQNLLGHFPHIQQYLSPIESYSVGMLDKCHASIYLGTYFNNNIPDAFMSDYVKTKRNVVWAGYNVWKLNQKNLEDLWGVTYDGQTKLDFEHKDAQGKPGFFKHYHYKGEVFHKLGIWHKTEKNKFLAAFEISKFSFDPLKIDDYALSWATNTASDERIPYILNNQNHWYVGDSPFSFMTEEDRYLIFSDLLFDILDEEPIYKTKPALFRVEDIHPSQPLWQVHSLVDMLHRVDIPYTIALIPIFSDPNGKYSDRKNTFIPMTKFIPFLDFIKKTKKHGASFVLHGITHQLGHELNPYNAMTGDDFEFWDIVRNRPIENDRADWVINRIQDGHTFLEKNDCFITAWEVPHYQASPLDYSLFGQMFTWNLGRFIYFPHQKHSWKRLDDQYALNITGAKDNTKRFELLKDMEVDFPDHLMPSGQFYPYEVWGDVYDQRIIPENVGNFQPFANFQVPAPRTVDDLIEVVRRNRVLRDVWASVFMHPHLLETTWHEGLGEYRGDTRELERYIAAVKEAGYEFISLNDFVEKNTTKKRHPTIETE